MDFTVNEALMDVPRAWIPEESNHVHYDGGTNVTMLVTSKVVICIDSVDTQVRGDGANTSGSTR